MSGRSRGVRQTLKLSLPLLLLNLLQLQVVKLLHGHIDSALLGQDFDFDDACLDGTCQVSNLFQQGVRLANLIGCLLQSPLRGLDPPVAVVHIGADIVLIVPFESPVALLVVGGGEIFFAKIWLVGSGARAEILLGVGEEVVGAAAAEIGTADLGVGDGEGGLFVHAGRGHHGVAHELLEQLALFGGHVGLRSLESIFGEVQQVQSLVWSIYDLLVVGSGTGSVLPLSHASMHAPPPPPVPWTSSHISSPTPFSSSSSHAHAPTMKPAALLALSASLTTSVYASPSHSSSDYAEHLHLKPLPGRALYAGFNFTASTPLSDYEKQHFRFFPRSLGQILQYTHTTELHLRFALGRWDEESWGSRPRHGRREGGTGVELWAWLEADTEAQAEERWTGLVNSLSGLFCASLNFIDQSKTIRPILSFHPEGSLPEQNASLVHLMHGVLPHEVVCTENLTPFLKLLPCKGKAGVSSLLDGHKVFDANWQTMSIDVRPHCPSSGECVLEIDQTVDMVLDLERAMRPRNNPIPRPPPIDEVHCDLSKSYNSHDTCYPTIPEGETEWSLSRIFGRPIQGSCPLGGREQAVDVSLDVPAARTVEVVSNVHPEHLSQDKTGARHYRLRTSEEVDLKLPQQVVGQDLEKNQQLLRASRQITGYGQERGGMHTVITNPQAISQRIIYLESLPWFLRPYMHTLNINGATAERMYYTPAVDRRKGTHLEILLEVPAHSQVELTYDFEKAILRYTEYPPDANRGFDVAPAIIRVLPADGSDEQGSYLRTTSLLLPLPTPDFSMPYNVIILTSTVIALGFGSIFNLLIRRFVLVEEVSKSPIAGVIQKVRAKLAAGFKGRPIETTKKEVTNAVDSLKSTATSTACDHDLGTMYARRTGTKVGNANGTIPDLSAKEK